MKIAPHTLTIHTHHKPPSADSNSISCLSDHSDHLAELQHSTRSAPNFTSKRHLSFRHRGVRKPLPNCVSANSPGWFNKNAAGMSESLPERHGLQMSCARGLKELADSTVIHLLKRLVYGVTSFRADFCNVRRRRTGLRCVSLRHLIEERSSKTPF